MTVESDSPDLDIDHAVIAVEDYIVKAEACREIFKPMPSAAHSNADYLAAYCAPFQGEIEALWSRLIWAINPKNDFKRHAPVHPHGQEIMTELQFFYQWMLTRNRGGYLMQTPWITWIGHHGRKHHYELLVRLATGEADKPFAFHSYRLTVARGEGFHATHWDDTSILPVPLWLKRYGIPKKRPAKKAEPLPWEDQEVEPDPPPPGSNDDYLEEMLRQSY